MEQTCADEKMLSEEIKVKKISLLIVDQHNQELRDEPLAFSLTSLSRVSKFVSFCNDV